jgi:hypothetical protein
MPLPRLRPGRRLRAPGAQLAAGLKVVGGILLGGLRELWALWLRVAEVLGMVILSAARILWPLLLVAVRAARRGIAVAERAVTPGVAVVVVTAGAALLLAASQFVDYRGIEIGAPAYEDVRAVAPAPQTDRQTTGSVHGYAMLPVAAVALVALAFALRGRWQLGRVVSLLGALVIAVTLLFDARRGLDEGEAALAYQGAHAVLIEGFWLQLSSAVVLVAGGLLVARYIRLARRQAPGLARERRGARRRRRDGARVAGVRA